jgi:hypothetical protein
MNYKSDKVSINVSSGCEQKKLIFGIIKFVKQTNITYQKSNFHNPIVLQHQMSVCALHELNSIAS